jgi:hypothetical protein
MSILNTPQVVGDIARSYVRGAEAAESSQKRRETQGRLRKQFELEQEKVREREKDKVERRRRLSGPAPPPAPQQPLFKAEPPPDDPGGSYRALDRMRPATTKQLKEWEAQTASLSAPRFQLARTLYGKIKSSSDEGLMREANRLADLMMGDDLTEKLEGANGLIELWNNSQAAMEEVAQK